MSAVRSAPSVVLPPGRGVTYDAGMLIAGDRSDQRAWFFHRLALEEGHVPTVPAAVLAQVWRGGPQPMLSRMLDGCVVEPLDHPTARATGAACAMASTADVVDASVVVGALRRGDVVVSNDPDDLTRIAEAIGLPLAVIDI